MWAASSGRGATGITGRSPRHSPLFLRSAAWIAAGTHDEPGFRKDEGLLGIPLKARPTASIRPPRARRRSRPRRGQQGTGGSGLRRCRRAQGLAQRRNRGRTSPSAGGHRQVLSRHSDRRDFRSQYRRTWNDHHGNGRPVAPRISTSRYPVTVASRSSAATRKRLPR